MLRQYIYTGSGDEGREDEVIDNLDISDNELEDALLAPRPRGAARPSRDQIAYCLAGT
jgi:hypothetical protein